MRAHRPIAPLIVASAAFLACGVGVASEPSPNAIAGPSNLRREPQPAAELLVRDGHEHMHMKGAPLTELNETLILQWHEPTPPSYATHDFEDPDVEHKYPYLMGLHALCMSLAFFGALPIGAYISEVRSICQATAD